MKMCCLVKKMLFAVSCVLFLNLLPAASVVELQQQLQEMNQRIDAVEAVLIDKTAIDRGFGAGVPLQDFVPPVDADKGVVADYVDAVMLCSVGNRMASVLAQTKLRELGPQHLEVLLEKLQEWRGRDLRSVCFKLVNESHKDLIVARFPRQYMLLDCIYKFAWAKDVRETLVSTLRACRKDKISPLVPDTKWIDCVVQLQDETLNPDLLWYFIYGSNQPFTYRSIKNVPGIDLDAAVAELWKQQTLRDGDGYYYEKNAEIAAPHGQIDALELLVDNLIRDGGGTPRELAVVESCLRDNGNLTNLNEIAAWLKLNKGKVLWDPEARKYLLYESP